MNRERFLDEIKKHFSEFFKGYHLVKKKQKKPADTSFNNN